MTAESSCGIRLLVPEAPYDLVGSLRPLADGGGDPTWRFERAGTEARAVRAMWAPTGAVTVELVHAGGQLTVRARGPGSGWVLARAEVLAGLQDDAAGFRHGLHPAVTGAHRRRAGARFGRALTVWDVVVPTVLGQRVTTGEARRSWWQLVRRYGLLAPGTDDVRLAPISRTVARLGDADWHRVGVERGRADAVRGLLRVLPALERIAAEETGPAPERTAAFRRIAESVAGVGPWTSTGLAAKVLGDPDVVLLGDLHVPHGVCHALAGEERGSDERMLELLEPFRPHRGRVVRLLKSSGAGAAPRRGPRYTPLPIARM